MSGARATCSDAECSDDSIGERVLPLLECDHGGEYFLLVFYNKYVRLKHTLDSRGNFMGW